MSALATSSCSQRLTSHRHHLTSEKKREMFESARWERRSLAPPQPSSLVETYVVATTFSPTRIFNRPTVINGRNARPRLRSTAECRRDDWVVGGVHWTWRGGRPVGWEGARAGLAATRRLRAAGFSNRSNASALSFACFFNRVAEFVAQFNYRPHSFYCVTVLNRLWHIKGSRFVFLLFFRSFS
jgi:hypothetical protein